MGSPPKKLSKTVAARVAAVKRATSTVKTKATIDFVRDVRGK